MNSETQKGYFWTILNILLALMAINILFFVMPAVQKFGNSFYPSRTMVVSAEGKTKAAPDIAETSFGVVSRGQDPEKLADDNNRKVAAAVAFVKSQGVDAGDIKTVGYSLYPDYRYDPDTEKRTITGYSLTQTVSVKIRDLDKVASIIGGLTPLGVNDIGGITFGIDEPEKVLKAARADAFRKAAEKAREMAAASGVALGSIVNVNESGGVMPYPYYGKGGDVAMGVRSEIAAPTIEPGTQELTVFVSMTYAIR